MSTTRRRFLTMAGGAALGAVAAPALSSLAGTAIHAQPIPGSPSFRGGAGKTVVGPVTLNPGVTVLRAQHNGTSNFVSWLFLPAAGKTPEQSFESADYSDSFLVFDLIGAVKTAGVALATIGGDHYIAITASGAWQVSVEQPVPSNVSTVGGTTFSGKGQDVSPYFNVPDGLSQISVQTASTTLRGWLYHLDDLGGAPVAAGLQVYDGRIFDFTFPGNQSSFPISLPDNGPYILAVSNTLENTDEWTITLS